MNRMFLPSVLGCLVVSTLVLSGGPAFAAGAVSVTTKSPEAAAAFLAGRDLADNLRIPEAQAQYRKALSLDPDFALAAAYLSTTVPGAEGDAMIERAVVLSAEAPRDRAHARPGHLRRPPRRRERGRRPPPQARGRRARRRARPVRVGPDRLRLAQVGRGRGRVPEGRRPRPQGGRGVQPARLRAARAEPARGGDRGLQEVRGGQPRGAQPGRLAGRGAHPRGPVRGGGGRLPEGPRDLAQLLQRVGRHRQGAGDARRLGRQLPGRGQGARRRRSSRTTRSAWASTRRGACTPRARRRKP